MPETEHWPWQEHMDLTIKISPDVKALWTRTLNYLESARDKAQQKEVDALTASLKQSNAGLENAVKENQP